MILLSLMLLASAPESASDPATTLAPVAMQTAAAPSSPVVDRKSAATPADQGQGANETPARPRKSRLKAILGVLGTILGSSLLL